MICKDERYDQIQEINDIDIIISDDDLFEDMESEKYKEIQENENDTNKYNVISSKHSDLKENLLTPNERSRSTTPSSHEMKTKNLYGNEIKDDKSYEKQAKIKISI